jgi:hypothetical protein
MLSWRIESLERSMKPASAQGIVAAKRLISAAGIEKQGKDVAASFMVAFLVIH